MEKPSLYCDFSLLLSCWYQCDGSHFETDIQPNTRKHCLECLTFYLFICFTACLLFEVHIWEMHLQPSLSKYSKNMYRNCACCSLTRIPGEKKNQRGVEKRRAEIRMGQVEAAAVWSFRREPRPGILLERRYISIMWPTHALLKEKKYIHAFFTTRLDMLILFCLVEFRFPT